MRLTLKTWRAYVWIHCVLYLVSWAGSAGGLPDVIRVGGLFSDHEDPSIEAAFRYAIYRVNQQRKVLRHSKIVYDIQHLPSQNSFLASKKACNQAGLGIAAIFGPYQSQVARHINSMCNTLEIPHIETRLEPLEDATQLFSINLYPDASRLCRAYLDLLRTYHWTNFVVVYEHESDLLLLQDIFKEPHQDTVDIKLRQVSGHNIRESLKELEKSGYRQFLVHLSLEMTHLFLLSGLQLGMIDSKHHYIITNLDLETIDMEYFRHNSLNLTGFRLISNTNPYVQRVRDKMNTYQRYTGAKLVSNGGLIKTHAALMHDAVYVLVSALHSVDKSTRLRLVNLTCEGDQAWAFGSTLYNYLNLVEIEGLTGTIRFDRGRRVNFSLDVLQLTETGLVPIGRWSSVENAGLNLTVTTKQPTVPLLVNKTLIITTILEEPYVIYESSDVTLKGNARFSGFCIDLLDDIAKAIGFSYEIRLVADAQYGSYDSKSKHWTGMVKEILDGTADLAVAPLTINYAREAVIDFTKPFMNLGISILFKRPKRESPGLFSFLNPLAIEIWVYVVAAYVVVSLMMFVLARFSPYEWFNPHPCNTEAEELENQFSLINSFWFAVGTLMQQGSDISPRAVSTRILGGVWWFFTLIIISSYTANLAAFLTVERMVSPIESVEDLAKQTKIKYGTIQGGSTMTFFEESTFEIYQKMYLFMVSQNPKVFVKDSTEGITRVQKGDYAFFMESTMIDYTVQRKCDLMQVGGLLDSKGYGIGTPIGSPYRDRISLEILNLQESGRIQMLYNMWWRNTGTCHHEEKGKESKALGLQNVGGIFVVLLTGLVLSIIISAIEFICSARKNGIVGTDAICSVMAEELRFAIRCTGSTKRPKDRPRRPNAHPSDLPIDHCGVDSPNGIIQLRDMRRSPINRKDPRRFHFHGDEMDATTYTAEYSDIRA